jgi:hypothetical protein
MVADVPPSATGRYPDEPPAAMTGFQAVMLRLREVIEFGSYYLAAQADRLKLTAVNVAMFAVLAAVAAFIGTAVVLTAGVLLVVGVAGGLSELAAWLIGPHFRWLGDLVTSIVILGTVIAGTVIVFKKVTSSSRERLVAAYEQRKSQQRTHLGTDVGVESRR